MAEVLEQPKHRGVDARATARTFFRQGNATLVCVLAAVIGVSSALTKGLSIGTSNISNILIQSSIRGVASVGQTFVVLTAGVDLSVEGIALLCAILGSLMMTRDPLVNIVGHVLPPFGVVFIMLLTGAAFGAINGLAVSRIGMPALIVTLAFWQLTAGLAYIISKGFSIGMLEPSMAFFGQGEIATVPVPIIIFAGVASTAYFFLARTTYGHSIYAVGGNRLSAWLCGINTKQVTFSAYVVSGFFAALASVIMTGRVMSASMRTLQGLTLDTIAAVFVGGVSLMGGKGSLIGVVIGTLIIGVINNALSILNASTGFQGIVKGTIIFTAVAIDYIRAR